MFNSNFQLELFRDSNVFSICENYSFTKIDAEEKMLNKFLIFFFYEN